MRQELAEVAVHLGRQTRQHVAQIRVGVVSIELRRLNEARDDRSSLPGCDPLINPSAKYRSAPFAWRLAPLEFGMPNKMPTEEFGPI